MLSYDLSVIIPARSEVFLKNTIENILQNKRGKTEVIAVLDGYWPDPAIEDHPDVRLIHLAEPIGQRAAQNLGVKLSTARYVAKTDAHCAFAEGFDIELIKTFEELGDDITVAPLMKNLQAFDWKCKKCGSKWYQGPAPTKCMKRGKNTSETLDNPDCDNTTDFTQKVVFTPRPDTPNSCSYRFDNMLHFQYANEFKGRSCQVNGTIKGYKLSFDFRSVSSGIIQLLTDLTRSHQLLVFTNPSWLGQDMASNTVSLPAVDGSGGVRTLEIYGIGDKFKMEGITTSSIFAKMVENGDISTPSSGDWGYEPSISDSVSQCLLSEVGASTISAFVDSPRPVPTPGSTITSDIIQKFNSILGGEFIYNEKTSSFHNKSVTLQPIYGEDLVESMSLQGSFFMCTRENYWKKELCDESWGSWGQQGSEVALKTWLSGGRVIINKRTWYGHLFRTQMGFSFPYQQSGKAQQKARDICNDIFKNNKWPQQKFPLRWLVEKFWPVPGWTDAELAKLPKLALASGVSAGILYFTDGELPEKIAKPVLERLQKISQDKNMPLEISLREPGEEPGYLTMFHQILRGLERLQTDVVFMAEHDVLYDASHFDFIPPDKKFWYDQNWYKVHSDGHVVSWKADQVSGLVAYRDELIKYYRYRVATFDKDNFDRKFEPFSGEGSASWEAPVAHIDIRHNRNLTYNKRELKHFRNKDTAVGFRQLKIEDIPNWNHEDIRSVL